MADARKRTVTRRKRVPPEQRFWSYVTKGKSSECWLWFGYKNPDGYGLLRVTSGPIGSRGKNVGAHRISWQMHRGPVPEGSVVCHKCDTPSCVNPNHLFVGTTADNVADRVAKGRTADFRGEKNNAARLTSEKVQMVRAYLRAGGTQRYVAAVFGVSAGSVQKIAEGETWAHLPEECHG